MASLTPEQMLAMADSLTNVESTLADYKIANYASLSASGKQTVDAALAKLSDSASKLYAKTVAIEFDDAEGSLANVENACVQINHALNTIADVQKAINVISNIVSLATAIASSNPGGIVDSASAIITSLS